MTDFAMADLGYASLFLGLILSLYAAGAAFFAARRRLPQVFASAKNALFVVAALTTLAVGILEWALITHQFRIEYVAVRDQPRAAAALRHLCPVGRTRRLPSLLVLAALGFQRRRPHPEL